MMYPISNNIVNQRAHSPQSPRPEDRGPKVGECFDIGGNEWPRLLARSSHAVAKDPQAYAGPFVSAQRRFLHRVGQHPARDAFQQCGLREEIMEICGTTGVDWQSVGLYRQGVADEHDDNPPTLVITVYSLPSPVVFATAARLVDRIEKLLERQVQMRRDKGGGRWQTDDENNSFRMLVC